jgi:hypothetical protein
VRGVLKACYFCCSREIYDKLICLVTVNTSLFTGFPLQAVMLSSLFIPTIRVVPVHRLSLFLQLMLSPVASYNVAAKVKQDG